MGTDPENEQGHESGAEQVAFGVIRGASAQDEGGGGEPAVGSQGVPLHRVGEQVDRIARPRYARREHPQADQEKTGADCLNDRSEVEVRKP